MTAEQNDQSRAEFERWIGGAPYHLAWNLKRMPNTNSNWRGQYESYEMELAWDAWQAARGVVIS